MDTINSKIRNELKSVIFLTMLLFLNVCKGQTKRESNNNFSDTVLYTVDTLIDNANIDNKLFSIEFLRDKHNEVSSGRNDRNMLTLVIKNSKTGKIQYFKKFNENQYDIFKIKRGSLNVKGRLFLEVEFDGGGSGFNGKCFEVATTRNGKIEIYPVYSFDELSLIYFKNDNEIIVLEGIWNFKENESHFSNHRYAITKYNYINSKFVQTKLGKTKLKYSSLDADKLPKQILTEIKKKEPLILESINLK